MGNKEKYLIPETEALTVCPETSLLQGSAKGFVDDPLFDNSGWSLD